MYPKKTLPRSQYVNEKKRILLAINYVKNLPQRVILIDGSGYDFSSMAPEQRLERYGNDWLKASPAGNIGPGKNIPPYLFLHVEEGLSSGSTSAKSAVDMAKALTDADIRASVVSLDHVEHFGANERIGEPGDITTVAVERFLDTLRGSDRK